MANLVCWASGMLQVIADKDTPLSGPVTVASGSASRLIVDMRTHGVYSSKHDAWYVPGAREAVTEAARMELLLQWVEKLDTIKLKRKGLRHVQRAAA